jgi:pimeloyl-ACP methyl ester carboxylesterase
VLREPNTFCGCRGGIRIPVDIRQQCLVYETLRSSTDSAVAHAAGHRLVDVGGHRLDIRCSGSGSPTAVLEPGLGESAGAMSQLERSRIPSPYVLAGHSLGGMYALSYAHRYPAQVAGIVLLDSMHPKQTGMLAGADPLLAMLPTLARTALARLFFHPKDGAPQARRFVRDVHELPADV